jgi:hypothetical protein
VEKIIIQETSANYDEDQQKLADTETLGVSFWSSDEQLNLVVAIGPDDHSITLSVKPQDLLKAVVEALMNPEDKE